MKEYLKSAKKKKKMYRDEYCLVTNFKELKSLIRKVRHVHKVPQYKLQSEKYENYTGEVSWLFEIKKYYIYQENMKWHFIYLGNLYIFKILYIRLHSKHDKPLMKKWVSALKEFTIYVGGLKIYKQTNSLISECVRL